MEEEDDVRHGDCCWGCCWTSWLHVTNQQTTVDLVEWTGYARCDGWTTVFAVYRWYSQSLTMQTSRTSAWRWWLPGRWTGWLSHSSCVHEELLKHRVSGTLCTRRYHTMHMFCCWQVVGPILWGHSGPLCHALSLLLSMLSLWTSILHCHSPGVATVARRLRYRYSWLRLILVVSTVATPAVSGNIKLEQAACGGSQWRMGPTFFKCFLLVKVILVYLPWYS